MILHDRIEQLFAQSPEALNRTSALQAFNELRFFLNNGEIRAAVPSSAPGNYGGWLVNEWVKKGILLGFRIGETVDYSVSDQLRFFDKGTLPLRRLTLDHHVRVVPGGSSIRDGAYVGPSVVVMPPAFINIGAYVDAGTLIDSHALVGSCAQIGKRVHLSAGAQVGGVLEPVNAMPVVIEDEVFVGANAGIFEGTIVKRRAVIAAGVLLTGSTSVYDVVNGKILRGSRTTPLLIPEGAVVVPGSRPMTQPYAREQGLSAYTPVIAKYRDTHTDAATALEDGLR